MRATNTQLEALEFAKPKMPTQRETIYTVIDKAGANGLTDEQVREFTGYDQRLVSARRLDLEREGRVYWRGDERLKENGLTSMVWVSSNFPHVARRDGIDNTYCSHCGRGSSTVNKANRKAA